MTDRELMQQALEVLERCVATCFHAYAHEQVMSRPEHFVNQNITALRERLAQPENSSLVDALYERIEEEMQINEELRRKLARLEGKTRRATRDEKIVNPGVYEVRE